MGSCDECCFVDESGSTKVGPVSVGIFSQTCHPLPVATVGALRYANRVDVDSALTEI
jgi:hypothetical protein